MQVDPTAPPGFAESDVASVETPCVQSGEGACFPSCFGLPRRSNSRSGYRLFARVIESKSSVNRMPSREVICAYFQHFGQIVDCYLPDSAANVAFVCFEDPSSLDLCLSAAAEAQHVLAAAEADDAGAGAGGFVTVQVSRASPRPDYSVNTDRVFVKGLSSAFVHRNELKLYFSRFGEVTDVYIPKDKTTGTQKRFAFVTFKELRMARAALAHPPDEHFLPSDGSLLQVMPAESRPATAAAAGGNHLQAPLLASPDTEAEQPLQDSSFQHLLAMALSLLSSSPSPLSGEPVTAAAPNKENNTPLLMLDATTAFSAPHCLSDTLSPL